MYLGLFLDSVLCVCRPIYSVVRHFHTWPHSPKARCGSGEARTRSSSQCYFISHNWVVMVSDPAGESEKSETRHGDKPDIKRCFSFPFIPSKAVSDISQILARLQLSQEWNGLPLGKLAHLLEPQLQVRNTSLSSKTEAQFSICKMLVIIIPTSCFRDSIIWCQTKSC